MAGWLIQDEWLAARGTRRMLMHLIFWIIWLSGPFFDILNLYGLRGSFPYLLVVAGTQIPMAYFHLYFLVPVFLLKRKYLIYGLSAVLLLFGYSYANFYSLLAIPDSWLDTGLHYYIHELNATYDVFEGLTVIIATSGLKYTWQALANRNKMLQLQKENLALELNALKAQINPHFLFNTLNNIYSLALQKSDLTPAVILKLSEMMRYVLYECNSGPVAIEKEIRFLNNYIELEKIRHAEHSGQIKFELDGVPDEGRIEPLLLIPLVENSFKHGLNAQADGGWVTIQLRYHQKNLMLDVKNSIPKNKMKINGKHGIGLENVHKRLELVYPSKYKLSIEPELQSYHVNLELKLN